MKVRAIIALLLVFGLGAVPASAGARLAQRDAAAALTPEEKHEVSALAESLLRRLEGEQDIAPLLEEMFVGDFAERLHRRAASAGSFYYLDARVAAQASREEVRRYYVAFNNLLLLSSLYYRNAELTARAERQSEGEADETDRAELKWEDIFPAEGLESFRNDPLLGRFFFGEETSAAAEGEKAEANEGEFIETVEQLREFTSAVERTYGLLSRHAARDQMERVFNDWRARAQEENGEPLSPRLTVLSQEWYGYPEGTRVICSDVLIFHVDFVRVEDRYRVLALYLADD